MKFISIRDLSGKSAQVWKELPVEKGNGYYKQRKACDYPYCNN